jgi:uncharacterized protein (DUF1800 family)
MNFRSMARMVAVVLLTATVGYPLATEAAAPVLISAVSRKLHAGVPFDVQLPLMTSATSSGIECRALAGGFTIVMTFDQPVVASTAPATGQSIAVLPGNAGTPPVPTVTAATFSANTLSVTINNLADTQAYGVTVTNVAASDGSGVLASAFVPVRLYYGDVNGDGKITISDIAKTKSQNQQPLSVFNFRCDINVNGSITISDIAQIKARNGVPSVAGGTSNNSTPTIGAITDQSVIAGQVSTPIGFSIDDGAANPSTLGIKANSTDQTLVPDTGMVYGGSGASRTLSLTPAPNVTGTCQVTVTVGDGLATATSTFNVTVTPAATLYVANLAPEHGHPSQGTGSATLQVSGDGTQAVLRFKYSNLTSPKVAEHLHNGPPNVDGPIIFDIDTPAPPSPPTQQPDGSYLWIFNPSGTPSPANIVSEIAAGNYYMNVHTMNFPDGEIRGQFNLATGSQTFTPPAYQAPPSEASPTPKIAARFLEQATFGATVPDINALVSSVSSTPFTDWIAAQTQLPATHIYGDGYGGFSANTTVGSPTITATNSVAGLVVGDTVIGAGIPAATTVLTIAGSTVTLSQNVTITTVAGTPAPISYIPVSTSPFSFKARVAAELNSFSSDRIPEMVYGNMIRAQDQLRQRVAFAYSQIFVVSAVEDTVNGNSHGLSTYHDMLADDAFVNFRTLLKDVTLHPIMGQYLNMRGNVKQTLPAKPNENYGREILQLFSIGLNRLQPDGTLLLDANGLPIPSYDQTVIEGFAQVFTGWDLNTTNPRDPADLFNQLVTATLPATGNVLSPSTNDWHRPMAVNSGNHSVYQKDLLWVNPDKSDRYSIAASSQTPLTANSELDQALDNIFNHPNVGPYICRQLIQRLVGSTPSTAYVYRVASVFNDNAFPGTGGVRGDMKAVIQAILLDYEARSPAVLANPGYGHLREPVLRQTACIRAFHASSNTGYFKVSRQDGSLAQAPYWSPTVFNFYTPDYSDPGVVAKNGLTSPELYIANENTNINYVNGIYNGVYNTNGWAGGDVTLHLDQNDAGYASEATLAGTITTASTGTALNQLNLMDRLDVVLMGGAMPPSMKTRITTYVNSLPNTTATDKLNRAKAAVNLVVGSAQYSTQK